MISKEEVLQLAELARLKLQEREVESLQKDISSILDYVGQVSAVEIAQVAVDAAPTVMTSVGPRSSVAYRWKCYRCGKIIKPNTAGAQSHLAKHVREKEQQ